MTDFHSLSKGAIFKKFGTGEAGLTSQKANELLIRHGLNKLAQVKKKSAVMRFAEQFKDFMILILLMASAVVAALGLIKQEYSDLIDAAVILIIVVLNAVINFVQQNKADSAMENLKNLNQPYSKVMRDGAVLEIPTEQIVVGDKVLMEAGDIIPADLYILESHSLQLNESMLTGESVSVEKSAAERLPGICALGDRHNLAHSGSVVTYGRGAGIAVATAMNTEMGKIASALAGTDGGSTPIQEKLNKTGKIIGLGVLLIAVIIFILNVAAKGTGAVFDSMLIAIALAVAAIPESLPAVVTIIMALAVSRMSKQNAIVRRLAAVETLGSCEIICSDKTGTLTQNKMKVCTVFWNGKTYSDKALFVLPADAPELLRCMQLCTDSVVTGGKVRGDPTENALVELALHLGEVKTLTEQSFPRINELPFDSNRKLMSTFHKTNNLIVGYTKGSPDTVLERCTHYYKDGQTLPITPDYITQAKKLIVDMNTKALRTLAFARKVHEGKSNFNLGDENNLTFMGVCGMMDPPREEVAEAVRTCIDAGMTPVMITGDHAATAFAIAKQIGLARDESQILTGSQLDAMSDAEFKKRIEHIRVYARVSPENKVRIVGAWKSLGKVVAMTGDGVNDAPSIKKADIGIGMGISGTELTKQVADMVLADDNFATIIVAIKEGRRIFDNIRKTIHYLFGTNLTEVISILAVTLFAPQAVFLLPLQILFINLATDGLPALALGVEKAEPDIMRHKPRKRNEGLFANGLGAKILVEAALQSAIIITLFFCALNAWGNAAATTCAFLTLSLIQLFHAFNVRTHKSIFLSNPFKNKLMIAAFLFGAGINVLVAVVPPIAGVFGLASLNPVQWLIVVLSAAAIIPLVEVYKLILKLTGQKQNSVPQEEQHSKQLGSSIAKKH